MPAPKQPNTAAATKAAAAARHRARLERAAETLRAAGWTVTPPGEQDSGRPGVPLA